jgi:hypothetical protein
VEIAKDVLRRLIVEGAYLTFDLTTKTAALHAQGAETSINPADLLILFQYGWVARYETAGEQHRYRITKLGRDDVGG